MYMTFLSIIAIQPFRKALIALLVAKEVKILIKYSDFSNVFLKEKTLILLKAINLTNILSSFKKIDNYFID